MKYFFVSGEVSGDQIASKIAQAIMDIDREAYISAFAGAHTKPYVNGAYENIVDVLNVMGLWTVLKKLKTSFEIHQRCKERIIQERPDRLILVDFGSFNLRLANWAKTHDIHISYVAPPKTWASRPHRNIDLRQSVDQLISLYPFAHRYFLEHKIRSFYFGHPLFEGLSMPHPIPEQRSIKKVLIAPGSRNQEVKHILPIILQWAKHRTDLEFYVSKAPSVNETHYRDCVKGLHADHITIVTAPITSVLQEMDAAIVTSGTATIQVALEFVPQIIVYRTGWLTYWVAKQLIRTPFISLVNLMLNRELVKELIQDNLTVKHIETAFAALNTRQIEIHDGYVSIFQQLVQKDTATRIATQIHRG